MIQDNIGFSEGHVGGIRIWGLVPELCGLISCLRNRGKGSSMIVPREKRSHIKSDALLGILDLKASITLLLAICRKAR